MTETNYILLLGAGFSRNWGGQVNRMSFLDDPFFGGVYV